MEGSHNPQRYDRQVVSMKETQPKGTIGIIGAGLVGANFAFALLISGLAREIVLVDANHKKAKGESLDLAQAVPFAKPVKVYAGNYPDLKEAEIIVITAGAARLQGKTRLDMAGRNAEIIQNVVQKIIHVNKSAILIMVTNPVDVLTNVTLKVSGFPSRRVLGSGTILDTARFRALISERCKIDSRDIHAYVIGEHGDSEVAVWSQVNIAGVPIKEFCQRCEKACTIQDRQEISQKVRNAAHEIVKNKGSTSYAISMSIARIVEAIMRDENSVLPVSTFIENYQGVSGIAIGVPAVINRNGAARLVDLNLSPEEHEAFHKSAEVIHNGLQRLHANSVPPLRI